MVDAVVLLLVVVMLVVVVVVVAVAVGLWWRVAPILDFCWP